MLHAVIQFSGSNLVSFRKRKEVKINTRNVMSTFNRIWIKLHQLDWYVQLYNIIQNNRDFVCAGRQFIRQTAAGRMLWDSRNRKIGRIDINGRLTKESNRSEHALIQNPRKDSAFDSSACREAYRMKIKIRHDS